MCISQPATQVCAAYKHLQTSICLAGGLHLCTNIGCVFCPHDAVTRPDPLSVSTGIAHLWRLQTRRRHAAWQQLGQALDRGLHVCSGIHSLLLIVIVLCLRVCLCHAVTLCGRDGCAGYLRLGGYAGLKNEPLRAEHLAPSLPAATEHVHVITPGGGEGRTAINVEPPSELAHDEEGRPNTCGGRGTPTLPIMLTIHIARFNAMNAPLQLAAAMCKVAESAVIGIAAT